MPRKILLVDADSVIPNIALCKLNRYHCSKEDEIFFMKLNLPYYPNRKKKHHHIPTKDFDQTYCSVVFDGNLPFIHGDNILFGGTGYDLKTQLPDEIENLQPDYSIYPDNSISYGFITRGCIRNCSFCKVPKKEGYIRKVNEIDHIVQHKKVKFLDNNILAHPQHMSILSELADKQIRCQFNQGLDIRLLTSENSVAISSLQYLGEYIFALDSVSYIPIVQKALSEYLQWVKEWRLKFFVYIHPDMPLEDTTKRLNFLKENSCLPYVMRDISCWESSYRDFYTDIAAYCNQVHLFKKMNFRYFLERRHHKKERIENVYSLYLQSGGRF